jgi:hypothetical protein
MRKNWRFTRILVSEREPSGARGEEAYQILYLAKPLLETLPLLNADKPRAAALVS